MLQTSITAWLQKPKAVLEPPALQPAIPSTVPERAPPAQSEREREPAEDEEDEVEDESKSPADEQTLTLPPTLPPLPPNIAIAPFTPATLPSLQRLTTLLLPIPYPPSFYAETLSDPSIHALSYGAFVHHPPSTTQAKPRPTLIGAIRCRLLPHPPLPPPSSGPHPPQQKNDSTTTIYISTLTLLSPYRGQGIATGLLHTVLHQNKTPSPSPSHPTPPATFVTAHVWQSNAAGRAWYAARGFEEWGVVEGYYRRLKPGGAVVVGRRV